MYRLVGTALVVLLGGCDLVFPIAAGDGSVGDDEVDADVTHDPDAGLSVAEDEDRDGVPNTTDLCPGVPDPDQLDGDEDMIGDACDPRPGVGGDVVVFSALFNADEGERCTPSAEWAPRDGFFEVSSVTLSTLDCGTASTNPARLTIETGWEILVDSGEDAAVGGAIGSDIGFLEAEADSLSLGVDDTADALPPDADVLQVRPPRLVVQLKLAPDETIGTNLIARVVPDSICNRPGDCDKSASSELTPSDQFGAFAKGAHARLLHLVLYAR